MSSPPDAADGRAAPESPTAPRKTRRAALAAVALAAVAAGAVVGWRRFELSEADIGSFWEGSWQEVAREMRGRYPKHNWPDNPGEARASLLTKAAQARRDQT